MTVAKWTPPIFTSQDATTYKTNIDGGFAVAQRIVDNFAPRQSSPAAMTVTLDAGHYFKGSAPTEVAAQTTGSITAPTTNPRIDRIVIDEQTGAVSVVTGTEAASPSAPAIPAGKCPVAQVLLQTTSTSITNSMITDERDLSGTVTRKKIVFATHDTATTGTQSVTGAGFRPKSLQVYMGLNSSVEGNRMSVGVADGSSYFCVYFDKATNNFGLHPSLLVVAQDQPSGPTIQATATLSSIDADGCTLSWTNTGSPTGIVNMAFVFER